MFEVEGPLRGHALGVARGRLRGAQHGRVVDVEQLGNAPPLLAEGEPLGGRRGLDEVGRVTEIRLDEGRVGQPKRLDCRARVVRHEPWRQTELGNTVRDQAEVGGRLHVVREHLKQARVVDRVVVVVTRVGGRRLPGRGSTGDVQDVREPFAGVGVERLVQRRQVPAARERRPHAGHAHAGGHGRGPAVGKRGSRLAGPRGGRSRRRRPRRPPGRRAPSGRR